MATVTKQFVSASIFGSLVGITLYVVCRDQIRAKTDYFKSKFARISDSLQTKKESIELRIEKEKEVRKEAINKFQNKWNQGLQKISQSVIDDTRVLDSPKLPNFITTPFHALSEKIFGK